MATQPVPQGTTWYSKSDVHEFHGTTKNGNQSSKDYQGMIGQAPDGRWVGAVSYGRIGGAHQSRAYYVGSSIQAAESSVNNKLWEKSSEGYQPQTGTGDGRLVSSAQAAQRLGGPPAPSAAPAPTPTAPPKKLKPKPAAPKPATPLVEEFDADPASVFGLFGRID